MMMMIELAHQVYWFIDFNGMSTHLELFDAERLWNHIHIYICVAS